MAHRGLAPQHPPSVRAQNSAPTAVGRWNAIRKMVRHPHRRARRAALINAVSPHQFSPFGNPLSRSPLQTRTRQRGKTAGGNSAASPPARLKKPLGPSHPAEPRHAALRVARSTPPLIPLAPLPPGAGRSVGQGRARSSHLPMPSKVFASSPSFSGSALAPLRLITPSGGGRIGFAARRPRAEERLQNSGRGVPLNPLGDARVVRRPAIPQASVLIHAIPAFSAITPFPYAPGQIPGGFAALTLQPSLREIIFTTTQPQLNSLELQSRNR